MEDIFERFPDMKPVTSAPGLSTVNGIGTMVYGSRDHDPNTNTYVKTLWFTVVFIPLIPLGAYRVADAPSGGWYFIGKVPVSGTAKMWPLTLVLLILVGIGIGMWADHTSSPSYRAGQRLAEADQLRKSGKPAEAARIYREVAEGSSDKADQAVQELNSLLDHPALRDPEKASQVPAVLRTAWDLRQKPGAVKDLFERGQTLVEVHQEEKPAESLAILEAVEESAAKPEDYLAAKQKLLERLVKAKPGDVELVSKLAVVYEQGRQLDRCLPLLEPLAGKLGTSEGARILGLLYFQKGKQTEASGLLEPYANVHLKELHTAQQQLETAFKNLQHSVEQQINTRTARGFDFVAFQTAPEDKKQAMFWEYFLRELKNNPEMKRLQEARNRSMAVVPVALDLGMMQLERGRKLADPAARKAELERAEKTFLSVRGIMEGQGQAKEQNQLKVTLGQVYYWLGRQDEGRKLFDEVLQAGNRDEDALQKVAQALRTLGAMEEARKLLEEAYNKPGIAPERQKSVALLRALTHKDIDDEILWLERADPNDSETRGSLASTRGAKALSEGNEEQAAKFFREAVEIYAAQPESAASLNNGALACRSLYQAIGDREALEKSARLLEKALKNQGDNGILAANVADTVFAAGIAEVASPRIDLGQLRTLANMGTLAYLYADEAGRQDLARKLAGNATMTRARALLDRALLVGPHWTYLYSNLEALLSFLDDREGLVQLERRAGEAKLDLTEARQRLLEEWQGKNEEKSRKETEAGLPRAVRLVDTARPQGGATFALAVGTLVRTHLTREKLGLPVDWDAVVKLAEEAHRVAPSSGTIGTLQSALLGRASKALAAADPEYREMADKAKRTLNSQYLVTVALWREGKPRAAALANADVKRVQELIVEELKRLPDSVNEWEWVMLRTAQPDEAARLAEKLNSNERLKVERALEARLSPPSPASALRQCWALEAAGKTAEGLEALKKAAKEGVPLPFAGE